MILFYWIFCRIILGPELLQCEEQLISYTFPYSQSLVTVILNDVVGAGVLSTHAVHVGSFWCESLLLYILCMIYFKV